MLFALGMLQQTPPRRTLPSPALIPAGPLVAQFSRSRRLLRRCPSSLNGSDPQLWYPEVLEETWLIEAVLDSWKSEIRDLDSLEDCKLRRGFLHDYVFYTTKYKDEVGATET